MTFMEIATVISLVLEISNGIGMILMYLRYIQVVRRTFAALKATEDGEVEIVDLLTDTLRSHIR